MADFFQCPSLESCSYVNLSAGEWGFSSLEHSKKIIPCRSGDGFQRLFRIIK